MKRAPSPEHSTRKKRRCAAREAIIGSEQEKVEALRVFAAMKATVSSVNEGEMHKVRSLLKARNLLTTFEPQLASVMPEFYCIMTVALKKPQKTKGFHKKLAQIVVSRLQTGSFVTPVLNSTMPH